MKQFKLLSVAFVLFALLVTSCNKTPHDKIIGSWDITKIENPRIEDTDIDAVNEFNKPVLDNQIYTFSEDKISKKHPEVADGEWEMNEEGTILTIDWGSEDINSPHNYNIKALTGSSLIIEEDFDDFVITTSFDKVK